MSNNQEEITTAEKDYSDLGLAYGIEVYQAYASNVGHDMSDLENWYDEAEEAYNGEWSSDIEFAEDLITSCGDMPSDDTFISRYIDWEKLARDIMYDYFEVEGMYFRSL